MFGAIVRKPKSKLGFTLIELLVVIAIIAILAAILFPVFAKAKESANLSRCLVQLSQIGKAVQNYVDDHDGRYPIGPNKSTMDGTQPYWTCQYFAGGQNGFAAGAIDPKFRPLYKYTAGNLKMWQCPDELKKKGNTSYDEHGNSYVINGLAGSPAYTNALAYYCLLGPGGADAIGSTYVRPAPRKTSDVSKPTKIWMVGERPLHDPWRRRLGSSDIVHLCHGKDKPWSPVVFCDGHTGTILVNDQLYDKDGKWGYFERGWWTKYPNAGI